MEAIEGGALQKLLVILATEQPLTAKKKVCFHALPTAWPPGHLWGLKGKGSCPGYACYLGDLSVICWVAWGRGYTKLKQMAVCQGD